MNRLIIIVILTFPILTFAQQHVHKKHKAFYPYISFNYNYNKIQTVNYADEAVFENSDFFGSEFGFSIFPKNETGLYFDYNNKLVGELGVREIYYLFDDLNGDNIVDYTITTGFFGSLDIGKQVFCKENSQFIAGIRISDKYISGISHLLYYPEMIEYDGFHLDPGIYGEYRRKLGRKYSLSAKLALSQSVLNFWKFEEDGDDYDFRHPLFTDLSVKLFHKSGLYLKAENNFIFFYDDIKPSFRVSSGIGFRF